MKQSGKVAGALLFVGTAQFILFMLIAECIYPGYSVSRNYISDLGRLDAISAPVFNISVFVLGLTVVASAYFLRRIASSRVFLISLILCGIGAMGVGVFPENFGTLHSIVSFITFFFGAISAIASYKVQKPPLYYFAVVLGLTSLVALVLFAMDVDLGLDLGGMERMIVYPLLSWTMGFGGYLMKE